MDIFAERNLPDMELLPFFRAVSFGSKLPTVIGSFSLESQRNAGDIDLDIYIEGKIDHDYTEKQLLKIIKNIDDSQKMFFIELKIQYKDGKKIKFGADQIDSIKIPTQNFNNIEFMKIDTIIYYDGHFKEMSINYWLNPKQHDVVKEIEKDIIQELKEKNYYKVIKRFFSIAKVKNDKPRGKMISQFLNNYIGDEYKQLSNLKAIKLLLENYDDPLIRQMIRANLINDRIVPKVDVVYRLIPKIQKKVNIEGKIFLDNNILKKNI
jgi:hypothetical protein